MLEREEELAELDSLIDAATAGAGGLAVVEGPAGIGKTSLLQAASGRARERAVAVLSGSGERLERDFPFGMARALFEPVLAAASPERRAGLLRGPAGPAATALGVEGPGGSPPGASEPSFAVLHGLYWLSVELTADRPLLIVVDDAHWADAASLRWLLYLVRRLEGLPLLVALGVRSGEPGHAAELLAAISSRPHARVIRPRPLSEAATGRLIGEALGAEADAEFARSCQGASGGNPFLVRQLATALAADAVRPLAREAGRVRQLGPGTVARALVLRLANLPPAAAELTQAVAVLGEGVDLSLAAALAGRDPAEAAEAADALARVGIMENARPLGFVHPIVQAAAYEDIGSARRAQLHAAAARLLEAAGAEPARIATHLLVSEPAADPWVTETLLAAALDARGRGAPDGAIAYLRRALAEPPGPQLCTRVLLELGLAEELTSASSAAAHLKQAYATLTDPVERGYAASVLGRALLFTGSPREGAEIARQAAAALPSDHGDLRRALEAFELIAIFFAGGDPQALRRLKRQRPPRADAGAGAKMLAAVAALVWAYSARPAAACAELALAARGGERPIAADNSVLSLVAVIPLALADRDEALDAWRASLADAHRRGSLYSVSSLHLWHGFTLHRRGELMEAETSLRTGLDEALMYGYGPGVIVYFGAFLAAVLNDRGDTSGAREALEGAGSMEAGPDGARWWLTSHLRLLLAEGRAHEAVDAAEKLEAVSGWVVNPAAAPWRSLKAQALDRLGARAEAVALAQEELEHARRFGAPGTLGRALRVLGVLQRDQGLDHLGEAVEVLRGSPARLEHAKALAALGAALRRSGERRAAREPLRQALDLAHRSGATALAERAREELVAAGARPRRPELSGPDALTASERRIARMASSDLSNRDIAEALFVTVRTVETHLSHVYQKLDLHSREGLAAALLEGREDDPAEAAPALASAAPPKGT